MNDECLLTINELAQRLQYSADWIRTQVRAGRLPAIRFNRRAWRFHWPTVLAALQQMQQLLRQRLAQPLQPLSSTC
jgi:excisionase family DNA binding protein